MRQSITITDQPHPREYNDLDSDAAPNKRDEMIRNYIRRSVHLANTDCYWDLLKEIDDRCRYLGVYDLPLGSEMDQKIEWAVQWVLDWKIGFDNMDDGISAYPSPCPRTGYPGSQPAPAPQIKRTIEIDHKLWEIARSHGISAERCSEFVEEAARHPAYSDPVKYDQARVIDGVGLRMFGARWAAKR